MVEQSTKEVDNEGIGSSLNPEHDQENAEAQLDGVSEHPDYLHLDTDGIMEEINAKTVTSLFKERSSRADIVPAKTCFCAQDSHSDSCC